MAECKVCKRQRAMVRYQDKREQIIEYVGKWQRANSDKVRAYMNAYMEKNGEKYREARKEWGREYRERNKQRDAEYRRQYSLLNREVLRERSRKRRMENPEEKRLHVRLRRERIANAKGHHTASDVKRQYEAQKGHCYYCHCVLGDTYQTDHVIPISRGGSDGMENIVVVCAPCNLSKGDKLPTEWMGSNKLL